MLLTAASPALAFRRRRREQFLKSFGVAAAHQGFLRGDSSIIYQRSHCLFHRLHTTATIKLDYFVQFGKLTLADEVSDFRVGNHNFKGGHSAFALSFGQEHLG